jgi:hypothetical protein
MAASTKVKCSWSATNKKWFIQTLLEQVTQGGHTESSGFKCQVWHKIAEAFNKSSGNNYDKQQLQSQYAALKKCFTEFEKLKNNSGFGWNHQLSIPTAPDDVWAAYLAARALGKGETFFFGFFLL